MKFKRLIPDAILPSRAHEGDAGLDLASPSAVTLAPMERKLVMLGFSVAIPDGFAGLVCPRSGLAAKSGVTVLNTPGIIDSGYRGEVGVILVNLSGENVVLLAGSRVAQLLVVPVDCPAPEWAGDLGDTERGQGGFGSTR